MKAFLFDLNGTMIDDMDYHTDAWHNIINNQLGGNMSREAVKMEMYGKNQEVLVRVFGEGRFKAEEMDQISFEKEKKYQQTYKPHLRLISGLDSFLERAYQKGIKMAIGSAAITFNIDFVLDGLDVRKYFPVAISADHVTKSKPDPETFISAAQGLGVQAEDCLVFEDNPKGVEAARRAGMKSVVITTMHQEHEFEGLDNILCFIKDYHDPYLQELLEQI
ncbi:HAD family phosphatase [Pedobacter sp. SYSU D00535]|uniref:HAD family hydrolase n=1 Tax=Pedobacter sp. SYSU D00535 TaxID=2810308 RepID=UPI001A96695F|nr:HAD family phosphatase [Pedobacter sp. SYSU D00535]